MGRLALRQCGRAARAIRHHRAYHPKAPLILRQFLVDGQHCLKRFLAAGHVEIELRLRFLGAEREHTILADRFFKRVNQVSVCGQHTVLRDIDVVSGALPEVIDVRLLGGLEIDDAEIAFD